MPAPTIYTIGHSIQPIDCFLALLKRHRIGLLVDIRTIPRSRRHPQFGAENLAASLNAEAIGYRHLGALGGLRKARPDSPNTAFRDEGGLRGYADYMETPGFAAAIDGLICWAAETSTAIMCAEAKFTDCHRQLTADALLARGVTVQHILKKGEIAPHSLSKHAVWHGTRLSYPAAQKKFL